MNDRRLVSAEAIARAVGGRVAAVPVEPGRREAVVLLPDGRAPLLVRAFDAVTMVTLAGDQVWRLRGDADDGIVAEIARATDAWARGHAEAVTLFELATGIAASLSRALGDRWTVAFTGTAQPREAWLHGPERDAASVGVFEGRVVVWVEAAARETFLARRADLEPDRLGPIHAAVREQRALYARNAAVGARVEAVAHALAARLSARLGAACAAHVVRRPTHASGVLAVVLRGRDEIVRVTGDSGVVRAHAGLVGEDGWDGDLSDLDRDVEAIASALAVAAARLTVDAIAPGRRYRVLRALDELRAGSVVRFVGYDDVDNHFGRYVFEDERGETVAVSGDFSTRHRSPLGEAHRILEPLDE